MPDAVLLDRSALLRVVPDNIPGELKARDQWVCWREEPRLNDDGTPALDKSGNVSMTKPPPDPRTGWYAEADAPATWATYVDAITAYEQGEHDKYDGIGYVMSADDPFVGVDLDHCRDVVTGEVAAWAQRITDAVASYTEI